MVDASAVVELLLRTPKGHRVSARLNGDDAAAPELLDVEVVSAIARLVRAGTVTAVAADSMVDLLEQMPATRVRHSVLLPRIWQLRDRVRIADGCYVACGELFHAPVLTCDARLARAALPGTSVLLMS